MSIVFFGSPGFAVPSLKALIEAGEQVALVVTQPDKARGRGRKRLPSPIKKVALENGIKVLQPLSMKDEAFIAELEGLNIEFLVVVAYGKILTRRLLDLPKVAPLNLHASLLPKYRGASPVTSAILHEESETGVTTMIMSEGLDSGDMLLQRSIPITEDDNRGALRAQLSYIGGQLIITTMKGLREGTITPIPQGDSPTNYARLLTKEDGHIDWSKSAKDIHRIVRALSPWPSTFTFLEGKRLKITLTSTRDTDTGGANPATVIEVGKEMFAVATGQGVIEVWELQPEGKRVMSARDFISGHRLKKGVVLQ